MNLLDLATVGTDALGPEPVTTDTAADVLLDARPDEPIERRILLGAGAAAVLRKAASRPPVAPALPPPAPAETRPVFPDSVAGGLVALFANSDERDLLPAVLPRVAATGHVLPPAALRPILRRCPDTLRAHVRPLLGERARWLVEQGAPWTWAVDEDAAATLAELQVAFAEATARERPGVLRQIRALDRKAGRDALRSTWTSDPAPVRQALVPVLGEHLGPDDAGLLEQIVAKDRSDKVKVLARRLLARLPDTDFAKEALAAAVATVRLEEKPQRRSIVSALLGRKKRPPTLAMAHGQAETIALLELVAPSELARAWGLSASDVTVGISDDDDALLIGLSEGALLHGDIAWVGTLLSRWDRMPMEVLQRDAKTRHLAERLLAALPDDARGERIVGLMTTHTATGWWTPLASWDALWPEVVAERWLTLLRQHLAAVDSGASEATSSALVWRSSLKEAAARLPVGLLPRTESLAVLSADASPRWFSALSQFHARVALRLQIERALSTLPRPPGPQDTP